jgi:hypothetical protein
MVTDVTEISKVFINSMCSVDCIIMITNYSYEISINSAREQSSTAQRNYHSVLIIWTIYYILEESFRMESRDG